MVSLPRITLRKMSKKEADVLYFLSFCIEQYKAHRELSGSETMQLFDKYAVTDYLVDNYEVLHTQSAQWLVEDIDDFLKDKAYETVPR